MAKSYINTTVNMTLRLDKDWKFAHGSGCWIGDDLCIAVK